MFSSKHSNISNGSATLARSRARRERGAQPNQKNVKSRMNVQLVLLVSIHEASFLSTDFSMLWRSSSAPFDSLFPSSVLWMFASLTTFLLVCCIVCAHSFSVVVASILIAGNFFYSAHRFFHCSAAATAATAFDWQIIYSDHVYGGFKFEFHCEPFSIGLCCNWVLCAAVISSFTLSFVVRDFLSLSRGFCHFVDLVV